MVDYIKKTKAEKLYSSARVTIITACLSKLINICSNFNTIYAIMYIHNQA